MSNQGDITQAWRTLQAMLDELRSTKGADLHLPDARAHTLSTLDTAYAAFTRIEAEVDKLGQELESQHQRLDAAMEQYAIDSPAENTELTEQE